MNGPTEYADLHQRLARIEKQNKRLKRGLLALAGGLMIVLAMGAKTGMRDGHFGNITASGVTIVDASGKELITIGHHPDLGTGLRIYNGSGKRVVGMGVTADEKGGGLVVADNAGMARLGLGTDSGVPSIAMTDDNGKKVIGLGGTTDGYGLVIMDGNEVERAGIGFKNGSSGFALFNKQGQYIRGMVQRPDGSHFTSYADKNGKEIMAK